MPVRRSLQIRVNAAGKPEAFRKERGKPHVKFHAPSSKLKVQSS